MATLDKALQLGQFVTGLIQFGQGRKQAKELRENPPSAGRQPSLRTTSDFPEGGVTPPSGNLANSVRQVTGFNLDPRATLSRQQSEKILAKLQEKDPEAAQQFADFVRQQAGGTPTDPTIPDLASVFEADLQGLRGAERGNFERQLGAISDFGVDLNKSIAGQKRALAGREAAILGNVARSQRRTAADLRLATATQFLPFATMKKLRDDSLERFSDQSAAESAMVVGSLNARHDQEEQQLRASLSSQGMNPEFVEAQVADLRATQATQVDTTLTDIRIKERGLEQQLDLATQQNVGFAVQTAAEGTARLADIGSRLSESSTRLIRDTQMQLLNTDLSIREMELRGKQDVANMLRQTREVFIPESGVMEAVFGLNIAMEDRERNADLQAFALAQGALDQLSNSFSSFGQQRQQAKALDTQQKANQNAALTGAIGAGTSAIGGFGGFALGVGGLSQLLNQSGQGQAATPGLKPDIISEPIQA